MEGEIFRDGSDYRYHEFIRDAAKGGQVTMEMSARCVDENVVAEPAFPRGVDRPPPTGDDAAALSPYQGEMWANVSIGSGLQMNMVVDTGATISQVSEATAAQLLANGEAYETDPAPSRLANGSEVMTRTIVIRQIGVIGHVAHDVPASVDTHGGLPLLGATALMRLGASVDLVNRRLVFSQPAA
jgi:hypothetical protein